MEAMQENGHSAPPASQGRVINTHLKFTRDIEQLFRNILNVGDPS
jgi:hypothetical protein